MTSFLYEDQQAIRQRESSMAKLEKRMLIDSQVEMGRNGRLLQRWHRKLLQDQLTLQGKKIGQDETFASHTMIVPGKNKK